jgi:alpha-mannosidase
MDGLASITAILPLFEASILMVRRAPGWRATNRMAGECIAFPGLMLRLFISLVIRERMKHRVKAKRLRTWGPEVWSGRIECECGLQIFARYFHLIMPHALGWIPQHHRDISLGRLDSHLSPESHFSPDALSSRLWLVKSPCTTIESYSVPKGSPNPTFDQAMHFPFSPASIGQSFGPSWTTHWFRLTLVIPPEWKTNLDYPLMLEWDSGSEAMVWSQAGEPLQGLTDHRNEFELSPPSQWSPDQSFTIYIEMAANGMFGTTDGIKPPDDNRYFILRTCGLGLPNLPLRDLYFDLITLQDIAKTLPPDNGGWISRPYDLSRSLLVLHLPLSPSSILSFTAAGMDALYIANKAINTLDLSDPSSWPLAKSVTRSYLGQAEEATEGSLQLGGRHKVYAIGHCHIDTAWLWPFSETRRKTARSWSSQLKIMETHPEHAFAASSAQQV